MYSPSNQSYKFSKHKYQYMKQNKNHALQSQNSIGSNFLKIMITNYNNVGLKCKTNTINKES
jgi:hypothetical protein